MKQARAQSGVSDAGDELDSRGIAESIASLASDKKAEDVQILRVRELVQYTDWFVIMSGSSDRQVRAIADYIRRSLLDQSGLKPLSVEGTEENQWVVIDYGDVVVHAFYAPVREYYRLEDLWKEAPRLDRTPTDAAAAPPDSPGN